MFEKYSKPNKQYYTTLTGITLDPLKIEKDLLTFNNLIRNNKKYRDILYKKRNVGYPKINYVSNGHYYIISYLKHKFSIIGTLSDMFSPYSHVNKFNIKSLGGCFFATTDYSSFLSGWKIVKIYEHDLKEVFPNGIPTTEKQLERWMHYCGYLAYTNIRKVYQTFHEKVAIENDMVKNISTLLKESNISNDTINQIVHLISSDKNVIE